MTFSAQKRDAFGQSAFCRSPSNHECGGVFMPCSGPFHLFDHRRQFSLPLVYHLDAIRYLFTDVSIGSVFIAADHCECAALTRQNAWRGPLSSQCISLVILRIFKVFVRCDEPFNLIRNGQLPVRQEKGIIKGDLKARYLSYIFMGAIDTFISAMVLDNQRIKSDRQKKRIADGIYQIFMDGAKKRKS